MARGIETAAPGNMSKDPAKVGFRGSVYTLVYTHMFMHMPTHVSPERTLHTYLHTCLYACPLTWQTRRPWVRSGSRHLPTYGITAACKHASVSLPHANTPNTTVPTYTSSFTPYSACVHAHIHACARAHVCACVHVQRCFDGAAGACCCVCCCNGLVRLQPL